MQRLVILVCLLVGFISSGFTQETEEQKKEEPVYGWDMNVVGILNISQTSLSNWTRGGDNAWSWQGNINGVFTKEEEAYNWSNTVQLLYGKAKIGTDNSKKSDDQIFLESVYTHRFGNSLNPYVGVSVLTQFTTGYDYKIKPPVAVSGFFDPGYLREGIGAEYSPSKHFNTRIGFAMRQTVADIYARRYSDNPDTEKIEKLSNKLGGEWVSNFKSHLSELIVYMMKLEFFSEMDSFDQTVVRWDNLFSSKIAKYLSVSLSFKLYYEPRVSKIRQLNQTLAVGLTYSII